MIATEGHTQKMRIQACALALFTVGSLLVGTDRVASALPPTGYCAPPADTVPPAITGVSLSRGSIDLTHTPQTLNVTVQAEDKSVGVISGVHSIIVSIFRSREEKVAHLALVSGTSEDGAWAGAFHFNRNDMSGTWHLRLFRIRDGAGNELYYIRNLGDPPNQPYDPRLHPDWASTVTVSGTPTSPWLHAGHPESLPMTLRLVDSTARAQTVQVTTRFSAPRPRRVQFQIGGFDTFGADFVGRIHLT